VVKALKSNSHWSPVFDYPAKLKICITQKSKHAALDEHFSRVFLLRLVVKRHSKSLTPAREKCNKLDLTAAPRY
jgi:hypothetical protein